MTSAKQSTGNHGDNDLGQSRVKLVRLEDKRRTGPCYAERRVWEQYKNDLATAMTGRLRCHSRRTGPYRDSPILQQRMPGGRAGRQPETR